MYKKSKDYARLYELATAGERIPCWVDYQSGTWDGVRNPAIQAIRDIAEVRCYHGQVNVQARGVCYTDGINKEAFIKQCEQLNLEFIEPGPIYYEDFEEKLKEMYPDDENEPEPKVSEGALAALDRAIEYFDKICVLPAIIDPRRVGQLEKLLKENEAIRDGLKEIKAALELKKEKESEAGE